MGENRAGDDMVCELWGEIEGDHCYSYLKPPWQLWQWTVAWRPYLGSELALSQRRPHLPSTVRHCRRGPVLAISGASE